MGIRDRPTSPRSPWQNGYAERLIGSIRRECLDHVVVFGERHLRHVLLSYMNYYNEARTHLSLDKDAPVTRAVATTGRILGHPILGGWSADNRSTIRSPSASWNGRPASSCYWTGTGSKGRAKLSSCPSGSIRWKKRSPHSASRGSVAGWYPAASARS